jgi:predicted enzyme related to lactoylglutathione lyase
MINAVHLMIYSEDPSADRAFLRDVLGYAYVDAGHDWLIFKLPPAEAGIHPADGEAGGAEMYFMCDDLDATLADLTSKGVVAEPPTQQRWGRVTTIRLPGGAKVGLYQPAHPVAYDL